MQTIKQRLKINGWLRDNGRWYCVVNYNGNDYDVPVWPEQLAGGRPEYIDCRIEQSDSNDDTNLRVKQDFESLISQLYTVGQEGSFRVRQRFKRYYTVVDHHGLIFRLTKYPEGLNMPAGRSINARVTSIHAKQVELEMIVDQTGSASSTFITIEELQRISGIDEQTAGMLLDIFMPAGDTAEPDASGADLKVRYQSGDPEWVIDALHLIDRRLLSMDCDIDSVPVLADAFHRLTMTLLERAEVLKNLPSAERLRWIQSLSEMARHAEDYREVAQIISQGTQREYIARQLEHLRESENLYQPERKFRIIICLFNLNEQVMEEMMDTIFDIILRGNKEHWRAEPFRSAFVDMLQLFIDEYRLKATRSAGNSLIEKMIKAIAIQQLLADDSDRIDRRLNRATYYRMLACMKQFQGELLLHEAFVSLFAQPGQQLGYSWDDVSLVDTLYARAVARLENPDTARAKAIHRFAPQTFATDRIEMNVDSAGVQFRPVGGSPNPALPAGLLDWENISILTNVPPQIRLKNKSKIENVANYWRDLIDCLSMRTQNVVKNQTAPEPGDYVYFRMYDHSDDCATVYCDIESDGYKGRGLLPLAEVARYIQAKPDNVRYFNDVHDTPLLLEAVVTSEADADGFLSLSMLPVVNEYFEDTYSLGDSITLRIMGRVAGARSNYLCVSSDGASCVLYDDDLRLNKGDIVSARVIETNHQGQLVCEFAGMSDRYFNIWDAFRRMLSDISHAIGDIDTFGADDYQPEDMLEEAMSPQTVREIVQILDRLSLVRSDRTQAFGMLTIAQLLCRMLDEPDNARYYDNRKSIFKILEEYEVNQTVDDNRLAELLDRVDEAQVQSDYVLNEALSRVKILNSLKHRDSLPALLSISGSTGNASIREAADLAIALLLTSRSNLDGVRAAIETRISELLGVKVRTSKLRNFGSEGQELEFKTSIIFPADNHMQPDRDRQSAVIMSTICGFLNSDTGGRLLMGVNDTGTATGVDTDMRFLGTSDDGYKRYIRGMINREMGPIANQCCDTNWIDDAGYKILEISIKPAPELISYRGKYWVRNDSEKRVLPPEKIEAYRRMHQAAYQAYK